MMMIVAGCGGGVGVDDGVEAGDVKGCCGVWWCLVVFGGGDESCGCVDVGDDDTFCLVVVCWGWL